MSNEDDETDEPAPVHTFQGDSLEDAKAFVQLNLPSGASCPCCGQYARLYQRPINATMAVALILIYQHFQRHPNHAWLHVSQFLVQAKRDSTIAGGDVVKLRYWGLLERASGERSDGSNRVGRYRITELGKQFVEGKVAVPKYAFLFNQRLFRLSDELITIADAIGDRFNYQELMMSTV